MKACVFKADPTPDDPRRGVCVVCCRHWTPRKPTPMAEWHRECVPATTSPPSLRKRAWNLAKALAAFVADGCKTVSADEYKARLEACEACELRDDVWCKHPDCGCNRKIKAHGRAWKCPLGRWADVEIVMPVYNTPAAWLTECWESIVAQTYKAWRLILVDDGTTDPATQSEIQRIATDKRVALVRLETNVGIAAALNTGLARCITPLIARMDADDVMLPERLERQVAYLLGHPEVDILGTQMTVERDGAVLQTTSHPAAVEKDIATAIRETPAKAWFLSHPTVMFRRERVLEWGGYPGYTIAQDTALWLRAVSQGAMIHNLPDVLVRYRLHDGQCSAAAETRQREHEEIVSGFLAGASATQKPRLAVLTPVLGYGGTERWTVELVMALRDSFDISVGVLSDTRTVKPGAVADLCKLCPVSVMRSADFPRWLRRFDIVKAWGLLELPNIVAGCRVPIVATSHGEDLVFTRRWIDHANPVVTHWTAVSRAAVVPLLAAGVPADRISVVHNAVDAERCKPTRPRKETRAALGFAPGEFVVGYLGRISPEKRVPTIADAVEYLGGDYRGFMVGTGSDLQNVNTHGGRVVIHPQTFAIGDMLAAMDCLVGLCDHEGFWRVGIEAAIAGVPLVSTRVGVLREIAEEQGVLWEEVPDDVDVAGVADAIRRLRASDVSERTRQMQEVAGTYSMERFGKAWKDLLTAQLLGGS